MVNVNSKNVYGWVIHPITLSKTRAPLKTFFLIFLCCTRMWIFFFLNNTYFQTISLVSTFSKLFRKLISWVLYTWSWIAKLSPLNLISTFCHMKLESTRLDFFSKLHQWRNPMIDSPRHGWCLQRKNRSTKKILPELTSLRESAVEKFSQN